MSQLIKTQVVSKDEVADNIFAFVLQAPSEQAGFAKIAGAHVDVHLPSGLIRQYSLTGLKRDVRGQISIAVLREPNGRGGSAELCDSVVVGDDLMISKPRNTFDLDRTRDAYRLLAGGIGLTPILHMAIELAEVGRDFQLDICARNRDAVPFRAYLADAPFADRVNYHFSDEGRRLDLATYIEDIPARTQLYVCGPGRMIREVEKLTQGWGMERVRTERFENAVEQLSAEDKGAFTVELARSGKSFLVPEDKTILELLNEMGVSRDSSCLEGVCGTCITDVISGDLIHRDACLYDEEKAANSMMAVCVSRAKPGTVVVLDL